ncbi:hypothetical protein GMD78_17915 [Ornithinibacillus sp. L9]|uniref:Lipoprotein n=1 Tax=Ornithinibacillus caprae TaxID=2678566 RepID=A0A6N8FLL1_9BACI|nr:hypothetical protein [Ornithinibacillus caprae]MUK90253.1 hypothetical protein [Ornithinibacillus caprae]
MIKKLSFIFCMIILVTACSKSEPALVKKDTPPSQPKDSPELIEQPNDDEETDEFIEFTLEDEVVMINLHLVPILRQYLHAVSKRDEIIKEMNIQRIHEEPDNSVYLLEFSCNHVLCSYLLLDQSKENTGHLVADLATLSSVKLSPDETKLLLVFHRESSLPLPMANIVVLDLEKWKAVKLENITNDDYILNYSWPILSAE